MKKTVGFLFAVSLLGAGALCGCSKEQPPASPPVNEVESGVRSHVPATLQLRSCQIRSTKKEGEIWRVDFEATLTPCETLYEAVNLDQELAKLTWRKTKSSSEAFMPVVIRQTHQPKDKVMAIGQLTMRKAAAWQAEDFHWELQGPTPGLPRDKFVPEALLWASAEANEPVYQYIQQGKFDVLPIRDGTMLKEVAFDTSTIDSILILHAQGISHVKINDLPPVLQGFLHFDPAQARAARARREAENLNRIRAAQREAAAQTAVSREPARAESSGYGSRPEAPPANVDDLIGERLRQYTTSPGTIIVKTKPAVYDDYYTAWKVEFEYSFYYSDGRSTGGRRVEGTSYAWFRDKLLVRWRDITPPRSPYP